MVQPINFNVDGLELGSNGTAPALTATPCWSM
jgi:hypothetical protein